MAPLPPPSPDSPDSFGPSGSAGALAPADASVPSGETAARLRLDAPDDGDDLDAQLQLATLRRRFAGAEVEPVRFRHWEVERRLGRGGMGAVYLARDPELDRRVALKILAAPPGADRSVMNQRLRREAQALAKIQHPNVVLVHGVDLEAGRTVIEMEHVDGPTLRQWQAEPRPWRAVVAAYVGAGEGLVAMHAAGLVHRDIKPDNLLMTHAGVVKVVDLGLAVGPRASSPSAPSSTEPATSAHPSLLGRPLTRGSSIVGTPGYMAPEQFGKAPATDRSDQFSFAASLYEALMGVLPFRLPGGTDDPSAYAAALRHGVLHVPAPAPALPRWLLRALRRALAFAPEERHPSMRALVDVLRRGLARRRRWLLGAGVLSGLVGLPALVWVYREPLPDPCAPLEDELAMTRSTDDAARSALSDRVTALGLPHLDGTRRRLDEVVGHHLAQWAAVSLQVCDARARDGLDAASGERLDRQHACLAYTRARLDDTVAAASALDDDALAAGLTEALRELEQLPACDDPDTLAHWPKAPPPGLDEAIAAALRLELVGDHPAATAKARAAVAASADTHPFLHAQALHRLGHVLGQQERMNEALAALEQARAAALVVGSERLFCEVVAYRAKLVAAVALDVDASRSELSLADACGQLTEADSPFVQADLLEARGLLALAADDPVIAARWQEEALALRIDSLGPEHLDVARSRHNLANAHASQGELERADAGLRDALALYERVAGPRHPNVAKALFDLGDVQLDLGALDEARVSFERARGIYEHVYGPEAPVLAGAHLSLARVELLRSPPDLVVAREQLARARALQAADSELDPHHPDRAVLLELEGGLVIAETRPACDHARALQAFAQATALWRRHDPDGPGVLRSTAKELEMLYGLRDFSVLAGRVAVEGLPLRAHVEGLPPDERGRLAWWIGDASLRAGRHDQAAEHLALALAAYRAMGEQDDPDAEAARLSAVAELEAELARAQRVVDGSSPSPTPASLLEPNGAPQ